MDDSKSILKAIKSIKIDLISRIDEVENKLGSRIDEVENKLTAKIDETNVNIADLIKETKKGFDDINNRADLIGKQLNVLDDDAPTSEDFNNLVTRVDKLEKYQNFATA